MCCVAFVLRCDCDCKVPIELWNWVWVWGLGLFVRCRVEVAQSIELSLDVRLKESGVLRVFCSMLDVPPRRERGLQKSVVLSY